MPTPSINAFEAFKAIRFPWCSLYDESITAGPEFRKQLTTPLAKLLGLPISFVDVYVQLTRYNELQTTVRVPDNNTLTPIGLLYAVRAHYHGYLNDAELKAIRAAMDDGTLKNNVEFIRTQVIEANVPTKRIGIMGSCHFVEGFRMYAYYPREARLELYLTLGS